MAMSAGKDGRPLLVIAQPGATYVTLDADLELHTETAPRPATAGSFRGGPSTELVCFPASNGQLTAIAAVDGTRSAKRIGLNDHACTGYGIPSPCVVPARPD